MNFLFLSPYRLISTFPTSSNPLFLSQRKIVSINVHRPWSNSNIASIEGWAHAAMDLFAESERAFGGDEIIRFADRPNSIIIQRASPRVNQSVRLSAAQLSICLFSEDETNPGGGEASGP